MSNWSDYNGKAQQYVTVELYNDGAGAFSGSEKFKLRCKTNSTISFVSCTTDNIIGKQMISGNILSFTFNGNVKSHGSKDVVLRVISGEAFDWAEIV